MSHPVLEQLGLSAYSSVDEALAHPLIGRVLRMYFDRRHPTHTFSRRLRAAGESMRLIGLTGYAGAGKDSVCQVLQERRAGIARAAFADALKAEVAAAYGVDLSVFNDPATKEISTPVLAASRCIEPGFQRFLGAHMAALRKLKPRSVMQQWGDYRRADDPEYWIRRLATTVEMARVLGWSTVIITDVRAANEAAWVRAQGGRLWRVTRPDVKPRSGHWSEHALRDAPADAVLANDEGLDMLSVRALGAFDELVERAS